MAIALSASTLQQVILALCAASAIFALTSLGDAASMNISGRARATQVSHPAVGSHAEGFSFARTATTVGRALRKVRNLPSEGAAMVATRYDISPIAVRMMVQSRSARKQAAKAPLHRGKVLFEAPSGRTFELYRPMHEAKDGQPLWALVDVDNVVADFSGGFGDEAHRLTEADRSTFPRNNANYDMREAVGLAQSQLGSSEPLSAEMKVFERWLLADDQLENFLARPATSHEAYTLLHRYFVEQGFYTRIETLPGAREGMQALWGQWPIRVVTKRFGSGPDFSQVSARVPVDSARWVSDHLGDAYDSLAVMGGSKIDFAGNVFAVLEDNVQTIADIRAANASSALRERAFATGVKSDDLDAFLARNNTDVIGLVFRWNYNKDHALLEAKNVVAVDHWSDAVAVSLAHRKLLTDPDAGSSGKLSWRDVPGLANADGTAIALPDAPFAPQSP